MGRIHLIELHEQDWCPAAIRDAATEYLQFSTAVANPYRGIAERLGAALRRCGTGGVLDLCSGAGGPWFQLRDKLGDQIEDDLSVQLTDLYPNHGAFARARNESGAKVDFVARPVSATAVPEELSGFRTMFGGVPPLPPTRRARDPG